MTTCFVTGGTGFAGAHFLEWALAETDWDLIAVQGAHVRTTPSRVAHLAGDPRLRLVTHDLTQAFTEAEAAAFGPVDLMACYASAAEPTESLGTPAAAIRANVDIALTTMELARRVQPQRVIWITTVEAFGPVAVFPGGARAPSHASWEAHLPGSPYAAGKAAQEDIAFAYWRSFGVPVTLARTMNLFGERQALGKLVPALMRRILADEPVTLFYDAYGRPSTRDFLHARCLAEAVGFISGTGATAWEKRIAAFNAAEDQEPRSVLDVARVVADVLGKPLRHDAVPVDEQRPGHEAHYALSGNELRHRGWKPSMTFQEGLERTVRWTLDHPEWLYP